MSKDVTYSIVVPVYNSDGALPELTERTTIAMAGLPYEIVFIDDGSKDDSWDEIAALKVRYPDKVKAVRLQKNYGQHAALLCAFNYAKGQYIITIDDDLQYAPEDILKLIARQQETNAEVVYAQLIDRQHSAMRTAGTKLVQHNNKMITSTDVKGSSFRLICRDVIDKITANHRNSFLFLDEVLLWYTTTFAHVDVKHYPRKYGKTGYTMGKLVKMYFSMITNYSAFPLKAMVNAGFIFSLLFFLIGLRIIYIKIFRGVPIEGWTSIMVAIFFSTSVVMFCLGILGIYLFKMFLAQQNKPLYTIKQVL
ncbi:MAG: glycosyltransferase family 2 protein [Bacteroidetes bacterium]|nr:glycosyltransferase family 2 protein [Bacteroidota bacterium]